MLPTEEQKSVPKKHEENISTIEKETVTDTLNKKPQKETIPTKRTNVDKKSKEVTKTVKKIVEKKETSIIEKIKTTVKKTFAPKKEVIHIQKSIEATPIQKVVANTPKVPKEDIKKIERDAVTYLITALKEHEDALGERDDAQSRLYALIKKVLKDREKAISNMEEVISLSAKMQASRIEKRNKTSHTNIKNNTEGK